MSSRKNGQLTKVELRAWEQPPASSPTALDRTGAPGSSSWHRRDRKGEEFLSTDSPMTRKLVKEASWT